MSGISETQSKLNELMNEYEVAVIGENRGRNRSGYSEKADKYYQKRRELKEFVAKIDGGHRWIPVSERLPEETGLYLVWQDGSFAVGYRVLYYSAGRSYLDFEWSIVTHWMPLPARPEVSYGIR